MQDNNGIIRSNLLQNLRDKDNAFPVHALYQIIKKYWEEREMRSFWIGFDIPQQLPKYAQIQVLW